MLRSYDIGNSDSVSFFIGDEIEKTSAHKMRTLFVVGLHPVETINDIVSNSNIKHIFFGANHSFDLSSTLELDKWTDMILHFLNLGYLCTLDIPYNDKIENFLDYGLCEYNNFIPQIRIPIPYINSWNYNTTIKIDDRGFNQTNPGVWVHSLHELTRNKHFTPWHLYSNDVILKQD